MSNLKKRRINPVDIVMLAVLLLALCAFVFSFFSGVGEGGKKKITYVLEVSRIQSDFCQKANVGDSVAVAADGIVQSVVDSEETKTTVTVGLGDGYEATYGLLDGVNVKSGDSVYKGQYLGTVAEPSAYYVKEGANLYFKLTKDGIPVNPMDYFE